MSHAGIRLTYFKKRILYHSDRKCAASKGLEEGAFHKASDLGQGFGGKPGAPHRRQLPSSNIRDQQQVSLRNKSKRRRRHLFMGSLRSNRSDAALEQKVRSAIENLISLLEAAHKDQLSDLPVPISYSAKRYFDRYTKIVRTGPLEFRVVLVYFDNQTGDILSDLGQPGLTFYGNAFGKEKLADLIETDKYGVHFAEWKHGNR
jgi:hypothetical protein